MGKFEYYLFIDTDIVSVDESFFKELLNLYSKKFGIWKFNIDNVLSCENNLKCDEFLYYYLGCRDINYFYYFGYVKKIAD